MALDVAQLEPSLAVGLLKTILPGKQLTRQTMPNSLGAYDMLEVVLDFIRARDYLVLPMFL